MILTYHEIVPEYSPYLYSVTSRQFESHLRLIDELMRSAEAGISPPRLTFDDGHASHRRYGLPLLEKYSLHGAFFVTAGWAGTRSEFMTWTELKQLTALGHEVQSHGLSHKLLTLCSDCELQQETLHSKQILEDKLGTAIDSLAAPGGRWNARVLEACAKAGYKHVYVSEPWIGPQVRNRVELQGRWSVRRTMDSEQLRRMLNRKSEGFSKLRAQHRVKQIVKLVLGERTYDRLWCWLAADAQREQINKAYVS